MGGFDQRFDQFVDAVAFGQDKANLGPCLGLYLSPETIYISQTELGKDGKLIVNHLVRISVPQDGKETPSGTMTMSTDFLGDPTKVADLIRQSISQIKWNSKKVVVTLSHHLGLLRYFPMPAIDRRYLNTAVPLEAKKYIPIPFDTLAYDYQAGPMPADASGKSRQGVLIAVSQKKNLAHILGLLQALGLELIGIEVAPCSVLRLWQAVELRKGPHPFVQAHFDGGSVRILICDRGLPVFFREVFLGGEATLNDQRKVDLSGCLAFAQKQLALTGISKIQLSGSAAVLGPWREALAQETGLPTEIQDTAKLLTIKGSDWGGYAAIGASLRHQAPSAVVLDLASIGRVSEDERRTARYIIIAGLVLTGLIGLSGIIKNISYRFRAREMTAYQVEPDVMAALVGLPPMQIENKLKEMHEQFNEIQSVTSLQRPKIASELRNIVEVLPENVWLTRVAVHNPLLFDKETLTINLSGRARGMSAAVEQDLAKQFKDALVRSEKIGKAYDIQLSLQSQQAGAALLGDVAMDSEAMARKLEERTQFSIELRARHQ
jgi:Tfp pilus assembly PilM family ATPase